MQTAYVLLSGDVQFGRQPSSFRRQPNASDTIVVRIQATLEDARLENLRQGAPRIHDELLKFGG
jgi:hypothetical protein